MATADQLISLEELRDHLGIVGDADDLMLTTHRASAIRMLERFTGRHILDRSYTTRPQDFVYDDAQESIRFVVSDLRSTGRVDWYYAAGDASSGAPATLQRSITRLSSDSQVTFDSRGLTAWAAHQIPRLASWRQRMRLFDPVPFLIADVGMPATGLADEWKSAVILAVRGFVDGVPVDFNRGSLRSLLAHFTPALGTQASV